MNRIDLFGLDIAIPRKRILERLRLRPGAVVDPALMGDVDRTMSAAAALCDIRVRAAWLDVAVADGLLRFESMPPVESAALASVLQKSGRAAIIAVTAGEAIVSAIRRLSETGDMTSAVIHDATGSEMAEAAAAGAWKRLSAGLARQGLRLTRRFSPGYGDLPVLWHHDVHAALRLAELGISITERGMIVPEKSTISVSGVIPAAGGASGGESEEDSDS